MADAKRAENLVLEHDDAMHAAKLAAKKGVDVQIYLSELVHRAIMDEI